VYKKIPQRLAAGFLSPDFGFMQSCAKDLADKAGKVIRKKLHRTIHGVPPNRIGLIIRAGGAAVNRCAANSADFFIKK
jgi:hypothetical protein